MKLNSVLPVIFLFFFCCVPSPAKAMQQNLDLTDEDRITLQYLENLQLPEPTALQVAVSTLNYETVFNILSQLRDGLFKNLINKPQMQQEAIFSAYRSELQAACDDAQTLEIILGQTEPDAAEKAREIIALLEAEKDVVSSFEAQKVWADLFSSLTSLAVSAEQLCEN